MRAGGIPRKTSPGGAAESRPGGREPAGMVCARALSSAGLGGEEGPVGEALREGSGAGPEPRVKGQGQETPWGLRTRHGLWILH